MKNNQPASGSSVQDVVAYLCRNDASLAWFGHELLEVAPGFAKLRLTVRPEMLNGHAICHGGVIYALADTAFAYASNNGNELTVTSSAAIDYLHPVGLDEVLTATARERHAASRTRFYEVRVENSAGILVALLAAKGRRTGAPVDETLNERPARNG